MSDQPLSYSFTGDTDTGIWMEDGPERTRRRHTGRWFGRCIYCRRRLRLPPFLLGRCTWRPLLIHMTWKGRTIR